MGCGDLMGPLRVQAAHFNLGYHSGMLANVNHYLDFFVSE